MKTPPSSCTAFFVVLLVSSLMPALAQADPNTRFVSRANADVTDPVEGKWLGHAGFPEDRIDVGFEFKRDAKGVLRAYLYEPVVNFYGLELPGVVTRDGDKCVVAEYALSLVLHEDKLEGTYLPFNAPISLARTNHLPAEQPVPELPLGPGPKWKTKLG